MKIDEREKMMAIKKKRKIVFTIVFLVLLLIMVIGVFTYIKLKNSYILKIGNAFNKLLNATSTEFEFQYIDNEDKIIANGSIEYNFNELELLANAYSDDKKIVLDVSREVSTLAYYLQTFEYWVTMDVTVIASDILEIIENFGDGSVEESFPVKEILSFAEIDDKIDISRYPNKLTKSFIFKFIDKNFSEDVLNYISFPIGKNAKTIEYSINPNVYELLNEFIDTSKLKNSEKKELKKELEENKKELEDIKITLSVTVNEDGYVENLLYKRIENNDIKSIDLNFNNINNAKVKLEEEVIQKLYE